MQLLLKIFFSKILFLNFILFNIFFFIYFTQFYTAFSKLCVSWSLSQMGHSVLLLRWDLVPTPWLLN